MYDWVWLLVRKGFTSYLLFVYYKDAVSYYVPYGRSTYEWMSYVSLSLNKHFFSKSFMIISVELPDICKGK